MLPSRSLQEFLLLRFFTEALDVSKLLSSGLSDLRSDVDIVQDLSSLLDLLSAIDEEHDDDGDGDNVCLLTFSIVLFAIVNRCLSCSFLSERRFFIVSISCSVFPFI